MIKNNLSLILGKRRMKMSDLSRMTGLNKNTILNLYHEKNTRIEFKVIDKICETLGCQPGDLFRYVPEKENRKSKYSVNEEEMEKLYREFASEDKIFAEEGMEEYTAGLLKEDNK